MNNGAIVIKTDSDIVCLTQEAIRLARQLGFGQQPCSQALEQQRLDRFKALDLLNGGALFCWDGKACGD